MDTDTDTLRLLLDGGTFVLLGAPPGTVFGIDLKNWTLAGDFRGLKMIPPGLHYVHYSAANHHGDLAPRIGFIHDFHSGEFLVRLWDKENERISEERVSEESVKRITDNYVTVDKYLAPYPFDIHEQWKSLTRNLNANLIRRLVPECGSIRSAIDFHSCGDDRRPRGENKTESDECSTDVPSEGSSSNFASPPTRTTKRGRVSTAEEKEDDMLPQLTAAPGTEIRFTKFPEQSYPENSTPAEITKHCMDQSYMLELMMASHDRSEDIIGELEFAYVCFLVGHSLEAFEHWKKLVVLLLSCEEAILKYRSVYLSFIDSLEIQIMEIPEEFLADIVMNNNIIYVKLREFFRNIVNSEAEDRLKATIERFRRKLTDELMWDFTNLEEEDEEDKPTVVII